MRILGANELYTNNFQSEVRGKVLGSTEWFCYCRKSQHACEHTISSNTQPA